jgi:hypothetical protein
VTTAVTVGARGAWYAIGIRAARRTNGRGRRASGTRHARPMPLPSRADTIDGLRELARELGRTPLMREVSATASLRRGVRYHFGTLAAALRATGLPRRVVARKWTVDAVVRELRRMHRRGERVSRPALAAAGRHDLLSAIADFGGIQVMRRRAGVPELTAPRVASGQRWDDELVLAAIVERHERGESLAYTKTPASLTKQGQKRFGSWRDAVTAAGVDYDEVTLARRWTDDELLEALRALRRKSPQLTRTGLLRDRIGDAAKKRFGGLDRALARARIRNWPRRVRQDVPNKREVLAALRARHRKGESVVGNAVNRDDPALARAVLTYFPSVFDAVEAAGIPSFGGRRRWSHAEVLDGLRKRRAPQGDARKRRRSR